MRTSRRLAAVAAGIAAAIGLAACSGGSGNIGNGSTGTTPKGAKQQGGTATLAWSGGVAPNFIFPYAPATNTNGYNQNLTEYPWPQLAASGDGAQAAPNPAGNLYSSLNYGNGDKT